MAHLSECVLEIHRETRPCGTEILIVTYVDPEEPSVLRQSRDVLTVRPADFITLEFSVDVPAEAEGG